VTPETLAKVVSDVKDFLWEVLKLLAAAAALEMLHGRLQKWSATLVERALRRLPAAEREFYREMYLFELAEKPDRYSKFFYGLMVYRRSWNPRLALLRLAQRLGASVRGVVALVTAIRLPVTRERLVGVAAAAAAVVAIVIAPSLLSPWLEQDSGLVSLVDSVAEQRSVLARLTGGFPHAPLGVPSAGGQDGRTSGTDRIQLAAGRIRESFGDRRTPSQLHAWGVAQLLAGNVDDAALSLLAASREQPANAKFLSDVAVVHLERARLGRRPEDLPRAWAAAERARQLDPALPEVWFNRALAASALRLTDQAKASWSEYLRRDSDSPWAVEARARLEELSRPTAAETWSTIETQLQLAIDSAAAEQAVRTHTTEARNFIENQLLVDWAKAIADGGTGSTELKNLRYMSEAMQRIAGDALYRDTVSAIDQAESQGTAALSSLARAHHVYAEAAAYLGQDRYADAASGLEVAKKELEMLGSPFSLRVAIDVAITMMARADYNGVLAAIEPTRSAGLAHGYAFLAARSSWLEGLVAFTQGRLGDAQSNYEDLLNMVERMGDAEQGAQAHHLLASYYFYLGDKSNEWRHRQVALGGLTLTRQARLKSLLLQGAGLSLRADNPEAALALQNAALVATREAAGRTTRTLDILAQRAMTFIALGRFASAEADVTEARRELRTWSGFGDRIQNDLELLVLSPEGELERRRNPRAAVSLASRALEIIERRNLPSDRSRLPSFALQLAKAQMSAGNLAAAKTALAKGIRVFEDERALVVDEARISALDQSWQLFETAVQLAIQERDYPRAFELSERARVRTLAESKRARTRPLSDVQSALSNDEAVVALNQFDDELAVWVIRRDQVSVVLRPMTRVNAARIVARQQNEIWNESSRPTGSRDLYNEIVRPIAPQLRSATKVVFVPDQTYQDTSFAALWDSSRQRFLVEDVVISLAPSVGAYTHRRSANANAPGRTPLVLGGPAPGADARARAIAALYSGSSILTGTSATPGRFLGEAASHSVIHVTTRTADNQSYPLLSRLMLADEVGHRHSGAVLGSEIAARQLSETDLVVIDEVDTPTANRGAGTLSLARAFMAAGVPAVLGTLPGAEESAAQDMMLGFHREMSKGLAVEKALQTVQRNAIQQNGRRLGAWSTFALFRSTSE
jgi:CHAT domain-containing protein